MWKFSLLLLVGCDGHDGDGDGFDAEADCDDTDAGIHPGAFDADGDGIDQNCDRADGVDADGDGYGNDASGGEDCDDGDPGTHPGATDTCDGSDEDCTGVPDDGPGSRDWYRDDDADGFGRDDVTAVGCTAPEGFADAGGDCNDASAASYPGAPELCDELDNDCDTAIDGPTSVGWAWRYLDDDGDGYGDPATGSEGCSELGASWVEDGTDCDDADLEVNPGVDERCGDGVDNDCDAAIDDASAVDARTWYADADGDTFGDPATATSACTRPAGPWGTDSTDCDDGAPEVNPGMSEICDGIDNDCDALVDDADTDTASPSWYLDDDADGSGDPMVSVEACLAPAGYVADGTDCDDQDPATHPGAAEVCDGTTDEDCDGLVDDADPNLDPASAVISWPDGDGDLFGRDGAAVVTCSVPADFVSVGGDCYDGDPAVNPLGQEVCGGGDEDCDGLLDAADDSVDPAGLAQAWLDLDDDGAGDPSAPVLACGPGPGVADNPDDCDDGDPLLLGPTDWLDDGDGDGFGDGAALVGSPSCTAPAPGAVPMTYGIDCGPADPAVYPGATELCGDGVDQDCSGSDRACTPIGYFLVESGPTWTDDPPVYSCVEACAVVFGGIDADWSCSTSRTVLDHQAYVSGYSDAQYCTNPVSETYSLEPAGDPGYNCGSFGCSYSAYIQDNCFGSVNWCWPN